jgi:hypothetical protein
MIRELSTCHRIDLDEASAKNRPARAMKVRADEQFHKSGFRKIGSLPLLGLHFVNLFLSTDWLPLGSRVVNAPFRSLCL